MIGEAVIRSGKLKLWHVTSGAVLLRNGTSLRRSDVAAVALCIVRRRELRDTLMRIMAGHAANSQVQSVIASAIREAIRLETDVVNPIGTVRRNVGPGAMTLAAKVRHFFGCELRQFGHISQVAVTRLNTCNVAFSSRVAVDALQAGLHGIEPKFARLYGIRGMAGKAFRRFVRSHGAPRRFLQVRGLTVLRAHCQIEAATPIEEADAAFVELSIPLKNVGLTGIPDTKRPAKGNGNRVLPVRYRVDALVSISNDGIVVDAVSKFEMRILLKQLAAFHRLQGARHRRDRTLRFMTRVARTWISAQRRYEQQINPRFHLTKMPGRFKSSIALARLIISATRIQWPSPLSLSANFQFRSLQC